MAYYGIYRDGVVILEKGVMLPEGSSVDVSELTDPVERRLAAKRLQAGATPGKAATERKRRTIRGKRGAQ